MTEYNRPANHIYFLIVTSLHSSRGFGNNGAAKLHIKTIGYQKNDDPHHQALRRRRHPLRPGRPAGTARPETARQAGRTPELLHITRQTPKRAAEVLAGGSIYWVIKGWISARQNLLALRPVEKNGIPHCAFVYDRTLIPVSPRPRRPFQGWRYLDAHEAPADIAEGDDSHSMPETMRRDLIELGLL